MSGENKFASLLPTVSREIARITAASQPAQLEPAAAAPAHARSAPGRSRNRLAADLTAGRARRRAIPGKVRRREFGPVAPCDRRLDRNDHGDDRHGPLCRPASLLEGRHLARRRRTRSWLGGLLAGLAGGAAGQLLFLAAPDALAGAGLFRVLGWTLLGALAGIVLSFFVPNLRSGRSLLGGAIGGAAGALGYLGLAVAIRGMPAADASGRILGATLLGLALGLTLALAERIARKAWLEICYGGCEIRTVNLGPTPVSIGSDARAATIYARGTPPVAFRYSFEAGKVIRQDAATNELTELRAGEPHSVGAVTVTLRTAATATARGPQPTPVALPSSPPQAAPVARAAPLARRGAASGRSSGCFLFARCSGSYQASIRRSRTAAGAFRCGGNSRRGSATAARASPRPRQRTVAKAGARVHQLRQLPLVQPASARCARQALLHSLRFVFVATCPFTTPYLAAGPGAGALSTRHAQQRPEAVVEP